MGTESNPGEILVHFVSNMPAVVEKGSYLATVRVTCHLRILTTDWCPGKQSAGYKWRPDPGCWGGVQLQGFWGALRTSTVMGPGNVSAGDLPRSVMLVSFQGQLSSGVDNGLSISAHILFSPTATHVVDISPPFATPRLRQPTPVHLFILSSR